MEADEICGLICCIVSLVWITMYVAVAVCILWSEDNAPATAFGSLKRLKTDRFTHYLNKRRGLEQTLKKHLRHPINQHLNDDNFPSDMRIRHLQLALKMLVDITELASTQLEYLGVETGSGDKSIHTQVNRISKEKKPKKNLTKRQKKRLRKESNSVASK